MMRPCAPPLPGNTQCAIRRAIRHGYKLGQTQPFFHKLVPSLVREMGSYFGELVSGESRAV